MTAEIQTPTAAIRELVGEVLGSQSSMVRGIIRPVLNEALKGLEARPDGGRAAVVALIARAVALVPDLEPSDIFPEPDSTDPA